MPGNGAETTTPRGDTRPLAVTAENRQPDDVPVDGALELARFTPRLLALLSNIISQRESATLRQVLGHGTTDWRIIAAIAEQPALTATEISRYTVMSKAVISRALAPLIEQGLVVQGDGPRGSRPLRLTDAGVEVYRRMLPITMRAQWLIEDTLTKRELATLESLLDRLVTATTDEASWARYSTGLPPQQS